MSVSTQIMPNVGRDVVGSVVGSAVVGRLVVGDRVGGIDVGDAVGIDIVGTSDGVMVGLEVGSYVYPQQVLRQRVQRALVVPLVETIAAD